SRTTRTDEAGRYRFTELPPGTYDLTVSAPNFQTHILSGVVVRVDSRQQRDFTLAVGPLRQTIEVRAEPFALDPESSSGLVLDRGHLADLPLNRRDFLQLAFLAPGVLPPVQDSELSSRGSFAMHASGAREEFNNFTIDGADNNDPYTNRYVLQPSLEAIREFKVLTSGYSAEYGRTADGQVNVVTRSGEGVWHGAAYEYFRNRHLDARNFFDLAEKPGYSRNQFGAAAGGPAVRDRVFLFASWEGLRERRGLTRLATVPSAEERAGAAGRPIVDPFTRQPFAGNVVPAGRISPIARRILDLYPLPNLPGAAGNLLSQPLLTGRLDHAWLRSDWRLSERSQLSARYGHGDEDLLEPFAEESTDIPGFGNVVRNTGASFAVDHQLVLGPSTVQTARFSYGRSFRRALPQNHQTDAGALWGVGWLNVRERDRGFPSIKTAGYSLAGDVDQLPLERTTGVFEGQYSISLGRGPHALRLGAGLRHSRLDGFLDFFARGSLTFSGAISGTGISDLLLGFPSFGIQSQFDNRQSLRGNAWNVYAQDEWRVRRTVILSLGLRYEFNQPPVDPEDRMYTLDLASGRTVQVGAGGVPRAGDRADRNNLAPR
ncbi:MAG: carboxypeptidase regulatory-like domain-containing protein, partial [Bryobacteraceae bacterium]